MNLDSLLAQAVEELSGVRAKSHVVEISKFHRIQASSGYDEAIEYVRRAIDRVGIASEISSFPADGRSKTWGWTAPIGWRIRSGRLQQIEPTERTLCSFDEQPISVLGQSGGGHAEGELVHVGKGVLSEEIQGMDLRGKFVLSCGRAPEVVECIRDRGCAGLIVYPDTARAAASYDLSQYAGLFPTAEQLDTTPMGFSISRRVADSLIQELGNGAVHLRGEVDAEYFEGSMQILEAWIPGSDPTAGEVLLSAHLCHPSQSANDNGSGSGLLLEIARTLHEVQHARPLHNTVRFLWIPEFNGTVPWAAANVEKLKNVRFAINLDMVGESPERIGEPLRVFRVPNSSPTYLNACFEPLLERIAEDEKTFCPQGSRRQLHWILDSPSGGSDHLVFQASPHGLPAVMLGHDDPYWHTNLDTIDKVDPTRLKHVGLLATALAAMPTWASAEVATLVGWLLAYGCRELSRVGALTQQVDPNTRQGLCRMAVEIEKRRSQSLSELVGGDAWSVPDGRTALDAMARAIGMSCSSEAVFSGPKPRRVLDGPVCHAIVEEFTESERSFFAEKLCAGHRAAVESLVNLSDGSRTVDEIAQCMMLDFGAQFSKEVVARGVELMVKCGYLVL